MTMLNTVAIVGRMNVGKSTLFNRLSNTVKTLTLDYAGVTRDVIRDRVEWNNAIFELVDTGGLALKKQPDILSEKVREKALEVVKGATIVLFVIDGSCGVTQEDRDISNFLHRTHKKVIVIVNKTDKTQSQESAHEAYSLGHRDVVFVSAEHSRGINDVLDLLVEALSGHVSAERVIPAYNVMLLGRPNVGKSSLMNALLSYERTIVSDIPGTTREPVSQTVLFQKEHLTLTDTPGIRRRGAIGEHLEHLMVHRAFRALKDADIVLLLIDAAEGKMVSQDLKLASYAFSQQHKALAVLINKSDLATPEHRATLEQSFDFYSSFLKKVPVLSVSCKTGKNIGRIMPLIRDMWQRYNQTWDDADLTVLFTTALIKRPLMRARKPLRVYAARQVKTAPPTCVLEVNDPAGFGPAQCAFFENLLRKHFDLTGVPVNILVRKSKDHTHE